jgi:hypothetical protein
LKAVRTHDPIIAELDFAIDNDIPLTALGIQTGGWRRIVGLIPPQFAGDAERR